MQHPLREHAPFRLRKHAPVIPMAWADPRRRGRLDDLEGDSSPAPTAAADMTPSRNLGGVTRYCWFESTPLLQTVRLSPDLAAVPGKTRVFRHFGGRAGRPRRPRRAKAEQHRAE